MLPYDIVNISMNSEDGTVYEEIPVNGDFDLDIELQSTTESISPAVVFAAAYDNNGCLISISSEDITEEILSEGICRLHIDQSTTEIADLKVFIWDSLSGIKPLADTIIISNQNI